MNSLHKSCSLILSLILAALLLTSCTPKAAEQPETVQRVYFADVDIEMAVRETINKPNGVILASELEQLYYLNLSMPYPEISEITGLEYCTNLRWLILSNNEIEDISPLASLVNLVYLNLGHNSISDISPLAHLKNLTGLSLEDNKISDISSLASLTNLTSLRLDSNSISDISPLASMQHLSELRLSNNRIVDISPLSSLVSLHILYLTKNIIANVFPLASLPDLTSLWLGDNMIYTISPLLSLTHLNFLLLDGNPLDEASTGKIIPILTSNGVNVCYLSKSDFQKILRLLLTSGNPGRYSIIVPEMSYRYFSKYFSYNYSIESFRIQQFQEKGYDITDLVGIFCDRNIEPVMMDIESSREHGYVIDYDGKYRSYMKEPMFGFEKLQAENPGAGGFLEISVPAYDPRTNMILVYEGAWSHFLMGGGDLVLYEYKNGSLIKLCSVTVWIS